MASEVWQAHHNAIVEAGFPAKVVRHIKGVDLQYAHAVNALVNTGVDAAL